MILPDANLLIYAVNRDAPHHRQARKWLEQVLSGSEAVGMAWIVLLAFIRITTHHRLFDHPLKVEQALDYVEGWLGQPYVRPVTPGEKHWLIMNRLLRNSGSAGNLTSDAHLAAIALEHGCSVYSADHDFKRFDGLECVNPLSVVHDDEPTREG
ncbi:MAG: type II toxin-antitoxin system VapC family toxin [Wenzhouxiangellaceae bacterium]